MTENVTYRWHPRDDGRGEAGWLADVERGSHVHRCPICSYDVTCGAELTASGNCAFAGSWCEPCAWPDIFPDWHDELDAGKHGIIDAERRALLTARKQEIVAEAAVDFIQSALDEGHDASTTGAPDLQP